MVQFYLLKLLSLCFRLYTPLKTGKHILKRHFQIYIHRPRTEIQTNGNGDEIYRELFQVIPE